MNLKNNFSILIIFLMLCLTILQNRNDLYAQTNSNISTSDYFDGEPYIAVNPQNQNNLIIAWIGIANFRISIKTICSFDGGQTWGNINSIPHFGTTWGSADPTMCFKADGTVYLGYIDYTKITPASGGIYVAKSTNGGISWETPVLAFAHSEDATKLPIDRPWLVIDNSSANTNGNLYLTSKPAPWIYPPNRPYFKRSTDDGQTWSSYRFVDTTNYLVGNIIAAPMASPGVNASGKLCIVYPSYLPSQSLYPRYLMAQSQNGGISFDYKVMLQQVISGNDTNLKSGYHLATHPSDPNKMAFCFVAKLSSDEDIYTLSTSDGGQTWSSPKRVNTDASGNGVMQDMPWCSYNSDGKLCITWRDRRNATGTGFYQSNDFYGAVSDDNGITFLPEFRLSSATAQFDSILIENGNDFMGCELVGNNLYATWGDTRTGELEIYFVKYDISGTDAPKPIIVSKENTISIFPNPSSESIIVKLPFNSKKQINVVIRNTTGAIIYNNKFSSEEEIKISNLSDYSDGVYFIEVNANNKKFTSKFVLQK